MTDIDSILRAIQQEADVVRRAMASVPSLEAALTAIEQAQRQIEAFSERDLATITELVRTANVVAQRRAEEEPHLRELYGILAAEGWVGLENYLHADTAEILREVKEKGTAWLEEEICGDFWTDDSVDMNGLLEGWWTVAYLADRRDLIDDAIRAHRQGRYALAVSALMPLIDGLTAALLDAPPDKTTRVRDAAEAYHQHEQEAWSDCLLQVVNEQIYKRYNFRTEAPPSMINRHGILHGRISGFGTEANSVRTILLVDVFARIAREKVIRSTVA